MSNLYHILGEISGYNPYFLRHMVANYMIKNPIINGESVSYLIKIEHGIELEEYVSNLRKSDTQFGSFEIKAYCDCLSRNVKLYTNGDNNCITFYSNKDNDIYDKIEFNGYLYQKKY